MEELVFRKLQEVLKWSLQHDFCCNRLGSSSVFTLLVEYIYALRNVSYRWNLQMPCWLCSFRRGSNVDNWCMAEHELATYRGHLLSQVTTAEDHQDSSVRKSNSFLDFVADILLSYPHMLDPSCTQLLSLRRCTSTLYS
jgi:hypothetical protein